MHQNITRTIVQTLLVLSILSLVYAAPVVPREVRDTGNDVMVVAENVTTGSDRWRDTPPGGTTVTTPSQRSSSSSPDGSPPHDSLPLDDPKSALFQGSESSTKWAPLNHLSTTDGKMPMHNSITGGSTSSHHSTDGRVPIKFYNNPRAKKAALLTIFLVLNAASVTYFALHKHD